MLLPRAMSTTAMTMRRPPAEKAAAVLNMCADQVPALLCNPPDDLVRILDGLDDEVGTGNDVPPDGLAARFPLPSGTMTAMPKRLFGSTLGTAVQRLGRTAARGRLPMR